MARGKKNFMKLASLRFTIKPSEEWRIENLGLDGGYSYRLIASRAFGIAFDKITTTEIGRVGRILGRAGIRVTDWRNGKTLVSRKSIRGVLGDMPPSVAKKLRAAS